ncbi:MAG: indolepyruvate ferredoxin oxidoreductase [Phycisphaerales bacterium]|nr:MAG: indolepyruvate ferredoxin oxidoreductase [Phycisphaerales bacterium]
MAELLMGDEAVALAAIHSGIRGAFSYPGTPATEIFEYVEACVRGRQDVSARWSPNEKVAYEEALGMSFAGFRALVSMKHVGLNVAADPFMSSALTGANGGLVLAVADDPGMHSSQNEQDSRVYGQFAQIPVFEPANQQEAYDMTREAFELSERFGVPVMVRLVTRLAHSRANVVTRPATEPKPLPRVTNAREWTLLPSNARPRYARLLDLQDSFADHARSSPYNRLELRGGKGVIASGIAYSYTREVLGRDSNTSMLKIGAYPVPAALVRELVDHCDQVTVIEEGFPFIERQLTGLLGVPGKLIRGKQDGTLPRQGELSADLVRTALGLPETHHRTSMAGLPGRPPQLCAGCPHCDAYHAIREAVGDDPRPFMFGDIGCYTLAALPPYNAIDTCVDMGASISMAMGAARAGMHPVIATIGDSTFIHSGLNSLVAAARDDLNMTLFVLDNATVAMTGGQAVFATGDDMVALIRGLGVSEEHLHRIEPVSRNLARNVEIIRKEIHHRGLSVIVACRPCIHVRKEKPSAGSKESGTTPGGSAAPAASGDVPLTVQSAE